MLKYGMDQATHHPTPDSTSKSIVSVYKSLSAIVHGQVPAWGSSLSILNTEYSVKFNGKEIWVNKNGSISKLISKSLSGDLFFY